MLNLTFSGVMCCMPTVCFFITARIGDTTRTPYAMKNDLGAFVAVVIALGIFDLQKAGGAAINLPGSAALPVAGASAPGFVIGPVQASYNYTVENNLNRALKQLAGTLTDASGGLIPNVAWAGPEAGGAHFREVVSFENGGLPIYMTDPADQTLVLRFLSDYFPGIPGEEYGTTQFSTEAIGLVQLPAGITTLAISAGADRTDANDDDGCVVFVGANPRDAFALKILEFERLGAESLTPDQYLENQFLVNAPVAGVYPFRIVHWQTGKGANLQFYAITSTNTAERILINDPADPRSPRAFRNSSDPRFNQPYTGQVYPVPGSAGVSSSTPVEALLFDGSSAAVNTNSIELFLNSAKVKPQTIAKAGVMTTLRFNPEAGWADAYNSVKLVYKDSANQNYTNEWSFTAGGLAMSVTGQWDFEQGDLRATVGKALTYFDPTFDGPTGSSSNKTTFGSCS